MVKVVITAECIGEGLKRDSFSCPLALAIKGVYPGTYVAVGYGYVFVGDDTYTIPRRVERFVSRFDAGTVESVSKWIGLTFELPLPAK